MEMTWNETDVLAVLETFEKVFAGAALTEDEHQRFRIAVHSLDRDADGVVTHFTLQPSFAKALAQLVGQPTVKKPPAQLLRKARERNRRGYHFLRTGAWPGE
jgi:hypothetical protein